MRNTSKLMQNFKTYLFWFANDDANFRFAEIEALVSLYKTSIRWTEKPVEKPFWIVDLPNDNTAKKIAERSITLKSISELWAMNSDISDLHENVKKSAKKFLQIKEGQETSFKFEVDVFCNTQTYDEKIRKIEAFSYLPVKGPVKMDNPDITFQYFEYFGTDPNKIPEEPYLYFFGRLISKSKRRAIHDFSLKKRKFIGNTSMNPELAFVMANSAQIKEGDLVYDPFVGTGSLLVAAAYYGGYVLGVDIDFLVIHGRSKPTRKQTRHIARQGENVLANLKQYDLQNRYIDVAVGDSSLPLWRKELTLDAIITDPPYGIRESTERIGSVKPQKKKTPIVNTRFPAKKIYNFDHIMYDLLLFSAKHLKMGGRLVTWIPVFREDYDEHKYVPSHPCFSLISNCEQILSKVVSRRLLTYEKIRELSVEDIDSFEIVDSQFRDRYYNYKYNKSVN